MTEAVAVAALCLSADLSGALAPPPPPLWGADTIVTSDSSSLALALAAAEAEAEAEAGFKLLLRLAAEAEAAAEVAVGEAGGECMPSGTCGGVEAACAGTSLPAAADFFDWLLLLSSSSLLWRWWWPASASSSSSSSSARLVIWGSAANCVWAARSSAARASASALLVLVLVPPLPLPLPLDSDFTAEELVLGVVVVGVEVEVEEERAGNESGGSSARGAMGLWALPEADSTQPLRCTCTAAAQTKHMSGVQKRMETINKSTNKEQIKQTKQI